MSASTGDSPAPRSRRQWRGVILLMLIHVALLTAAILNNSVAFDEYAHLPAGVAYWTFGTRAFPIHHLSPPVLRLWAAAPVIALGSRLDLAVPDIQMFLVQEPRDRHWNYGE